MTVARTCRFGDQILPHRGPDSPFTPWSPKRHFFRSPNFSETPIFIVFRAQSRPFSTWSQKCQKRFLQTVLLFDVVQRGCWNPLFCSVFRVFSFSFFATLWNTQIAKLPFLVGSPNFRAKNAPKNNETRGATSVCVCFLTPIFVVLFASY